VIQEAIQRRATDIHVEPFDGRLAVRIRVDGLLREVKSPPPHLARAITSRIKILSGLGFAPRDEQVLCKHLAAPHGLIIVTGPTGSGKTTTLATALSRLNQSHRKILTIEDPIEYELEGVNQTQVKPGIGLTFATALRAFLRHDPDVIMVGEMRDVETAGIGIHAALTGHLVLTTLHTNSAAGAIVRLLDMGVDAYLLASCLRCVIGQRLVRLLCVHCREPYEGNVELLLPGHRDAPDAPKAPSRFWRAVGCERCYGTGYSDRIAIAEVLDVDKPLRQLLKPGVSALEIEDLACRNGMTKMVFDGLRKCREGLTTQDEVQRVAFDL
ncbi:MAG: GspE/PulE family protein, partial [Hyphomicrobiaceae bacterium]